MGGHGGPPLQLLIKGEKDGEYFSRQKYWDDLTRSLADSYGTVTTAQCKTLPDSVDGPIGACDYRGFADSATTLTLSGGCASSGTMGAGSGLGGSCFAYLSRPKPRNIVAIIKADEKKYGDETPNLSNDQPKNSGAIIRATPPYVCCIPI